MNLVERLRSHANWYISCAGGNIPNEAATEIEAADTIERLQKELETAREALERVCKAVEREPIAGDLDYPHGHNDWLGWRKKIMRPASAAARAILTGEQQ